MTSNSPKLILALETAGRRGGVALLRGQELLSQKQLPPDYRTAAGMTPLIKEQLQLAQLAPSQIELVAVTAGPGSFTGLRVGVTTTKTLAYALGCDVLGVNTLNVIAQQAPRNIDQVWAILDAQRQQLFAAHFIRDESGRMNADQPTAIWDIEQWLKHVGDNEYVSGTGMKRVSDHLGERIRAVDARLWEPQAETVGRLAAWRYEAGERDDFWKLAPQYFRQSAAEEKLNEKTVEE